jgi:hypothetical protein
MDTGAKRRAPVTERSHHTLGEEQQAWFEVREEDRLTSGLQGTGKKRSAAESGAKIG